MRKYRSRPYCIGLRELIPVHATGCLQLGAVFSTTNKASKHISHQILKPFLFARKDDRLGPTRKVIFARQDACYLIYAMDHA